MKWIEVNENTGLSLSYLVVAPFIYYICFFYIIISIHPSVKPSKAYSRGSVVMVDEIMNASPSKFRFPEAGLRVMVTSHFGPKTRLRMASRLIITEVQLCVVAPMRGFGCYCYMFRVSFERVLFSALFEVNFKEVF